MKALPWQGFLLPAARLNTGECLSGCAVDALGYPAKGVGITTRRCSARIIPHMIRLLVHVELRQLLLLNDREHLVDPQERSTNLVIA